MKETQKLWTGAVSSAFITYTFCDPTESVAVTFSQPGGATLEEAVDVGPGVDEIFGSFSDLSIPRDPDTGFIDPNLVDPQFYKLSLPESDFLLSISGLGIDETEVSFFDINGSSPQLLDSASGIFGGDVFGGDFEPPRETLAFDDLQSGEYIVGVSFLSGSGELYRIELSPPTVPEASTIFGSLLILIIGLLLKFKSTFSSRRNEPDEFIYSQIPDQVP